MRKLDIGEKYRHFKGDIYTVVTEGLYAEESKGKNVIYTKDGGDNTHYVRDYNEFLSKVDKSKYPECESKYRFTHMNDSSYNGLFITVEGGDRVGKSYAVDETMNIIGPIFNIIRTREPGGKDNVLAEKIRDMVLDKENSEMTRATEAYLYAASRAQHVEKTLTPLLDNYNIVLCDRYIHSSMVYQSIESEMTMQDVLEVNWLATKNYKYMPDHTFVFYLEDEEELERRFMSTQSERDRIESRDIEFFKTVNRKYQEVTQLNEHGTIFHMIECSGSKEEVLLKFIKELLPIIIEYTNTNNLLDYDIVFRHEDKNGVCNALGDDIVLNPTNMEYTEDGEDITISWNTDTGEMSKYPNRKDSVSRINLLNNENGTIISKLCLDNPELISANNKSITTNLKKVITFKR